MNAKSIVTESIHIITEYYANNTAPFFDALAEDTLWYGPAEKQVLRGRENILKAWAGEDNRLTFSLGNINAAYISPRTGCLEVITTFSVITHFPSGVSLAAVQNIHFTWASPPKRKSGGCPAAPKIVMTHITNLYRQHDDDHIYPSHYDTAFRHKENRIINVCRMVFLTTDGSIIFPLSDSVLYFESCKRGQHSVIHFLDRDTEVIAPISEIEKKYPGLFLRTHTSYLVNPHYVSEIRRFELTMSNEAKLPVPEKKYTRIKAALVADV